MTPVEHQSWVDEREEGYRSARALGFAIVLAGSLLIVLILGIAWRSTGVAALLCALGILVLGLHLWLTRDQDDDEVLLLVCTCGSVCPSPFGPAMAAWEFEHDCDEDEDVAA